MENVRGTHTLISKEHPHTYMEIHACMYMCTQTRTKTHKETHRTTTSTLPGLYVLLDGLQPVGFVTLVHRVDAATTLHTDVGVSEGELTQTGIQRELQR